MTSLRSTGSSVSRCAPVSASAISSSELKVEISPSASAMALSSAVIVSSRGGLPISAPSSLLRSRFSGVRRSWAMLSATSRMPVMSRSICSSMRLRFCARSSSSSPLPCTGMRRDRLPDMMSWLVRLIASSRRSTLRLIRTPPAIPKRAVIDSAVKRVLRTAPSMALSSPTSRPTSSRNPPRIVKYMARAGRVSLSLSAPRS